MGPAEAGAGTIGAGARDAAAAAESDAGPAGLGGAPGAAAGTASGSLGGSAMGGAPGSFGGLGVGGIGALGEGMAVGTPDAPGTIGGIASGTALGTSYDPNAPDVDSVEGTVDMSSFGEDADMAAAMAGTTDLAGATLGRATLSPAQQMGVALTSLAPLGLLGLVAKPAINAAITGQTPSLGVPTTMQGITQAIGQSMLGPLGFLTRDDLGPAAPSDLADQGKSMSSSEFGATRT